MGTLLHISSASTHSKRVQTPDLTEHQSILNYKRNYAATQYYFYDEYKRCFVCIYNLHLKLFIRKLILPSAPLLQKLAAHSYQELWPCTLYGQFQKFSWTLFGQFFDFFFLDSSSLYVQTYLSFFLLKITVSCTMRTLLSSFCYINLNLP